MGVVGMVLNNQFIRKVQRSGRFRLGKEWELEQLSVGVAAVIIFDRIVQRVLVRYVEKWTAASRIQVYIANLH